MVNRVRSEFVRWNSKISVSNTAPNDTNPLEKISFYTVGRENYFLYQWEKMILFHFKGQNTVKSTDGATSHNVANEG